MKKGHHIYLVSYLSTILLDSLALRWSGWPSIVLVYFLLLPQFITTYAVTTYSWGILHIATTFYHQCCYYLLLLPRLLPCVVCSSQNGDLLKVTKVGAGTVSDFSHSSSLRISDTGRVTPRLEKNVPLLSSLPLLSLTCMNQWDAVVVERLGGAAGQRWGRWLTPC